MRNFKSEGNAFVKIFRPFGFPCLSTLPDGWNWTKRKQGFWTSESFAKHTENKVRNHCQKDRSFCHLHSFLTFPKIRSIYTSRLSLMRHPCEFRYESMKIDRKFHAGLLQNYFRNARQSEHVLNFGKV